MINTNDIPTAEQIEENQHQMRVKRAEKLFNDINAQLLKYGECCLWNEDDAYNTIYCSEMIAAYNEKQWCVAIGWNGHISVRRRPFVKPKGFAKWFYGSCYQFISNCT